MSQKLHTNPLKIAIQLLLKPYDLDFEDLDKVFGKLFRHKLDYADLYFQYHRSEAWSLEEGIVKSGSFNIDQGVGVRAISGEKTAFAYSDDISSHALTDPQQWHRRYSLAVVAGGGAWGLFSAYMAMQGVLSSQFLLATFATSAFAVAGATGLAPAGRAAIVFSAVITLPPALVCFAGVPRKPRGVS